MTRSTKYCITIFILLLSLLSTDLFSQHSDIDIKGRWDLTIQMNDRELPSWLEVHKSGHNTLVGRFVFASGSARPVSEIKHTSLEI